jgi:hypothetical protein
MLAKSIVALAFLAFATQTAAREPVPYQPKIMKMSVRDLFGVVRRDSSGYQPTQSVCGTGNTCAEACGTGYADCKSSGDTVQCYNATAGQTCCPDNSGSKYAGRD